MSHWALDYLGKPWVANGEFDCWTLLLDIFEKHKGLTFSRYSDIVRGDVQAMAKAAQFEILERWTKLDSPIDLCGVGLARIPGKIFHVGAYIDLDGGMVIHTTQATGCIIQPISTICRNWPYVYFYAPNLNSK